MPRWNFWGKIFFVITISHHWAFSQCTSSIRDNRLKSRWIVGAMVPNVVMCCCPLFGFVLGLLDFVCFPVCFLWPAFVWAIFKCSVEVRDVFLLFLVIYSYSLLVVCYHEGEKCFNFFVFSCFFSKKVLRISEFPKHFIP